VVVVVVVVAGVVLTNPSRSPCGEAGALKRRTSTISKNLETYL